MEWTDPALEIKCTIGTETAVSALYKLKTAVSVTVHHSYPVFRSKLMALLQLPAGQCGIPLEGGEEDGPSLCTVGGTDVRGFGEFFPAMLMTYIQ